MGIVLLSVMWASQMEICQGGTLQRQLEDGLETLDRRLPLV